MRPDSGESKPSPIRFRPLTVADATVLQPINNQAYPAVPMVSVEQLASLIERGSWGLVAESAGSVAGFVLCFSPGAQYDSENYRYFESHFDDHLYIDRIVVAEGFRGQGVGSALYEKVFEEAGRRGTSEVTCEVNVEPPNPGSIAFHQKMGFRNLDTQATKGGSVVVQLMAASVSK